MTRKLPGHQPPMPTPPPRPPGRWTARLHTAAVVTARVLAWLAGSAAALAVINWLYRHAEGPRP